MVGYYVVVGYCVAERYHVVVLYCMVLKFHVVVGYHVWQGTM